MFAAGRTRILAGLPALVLSLGSLMLQAQSAAPTPIALEDYAKFKRITSAAISADGKWMHYTVTPNDGDATLLVKALDGDKVYEIPRRANAAFSDDGRWAAYFIAPPASEGRGRGRGARGGEPPAAGAPAAAATRPFEVIELATGTKSSYPSVGTFAFSPDGDGTLYKSTGTLQQGITEVGQVRMGGGVTPWSAHELYESQSPVHNASKITTPFMILHGTADGSVDWSQGLEFYAAARRLGKKVILLSYPDEAHHSDGARIRRTSRSA